MHTVIRLADKAARALGIGCPRIGVAGLNPHVGEGGLFRAEEIEEVGPAIEEARALRINAEGPVPPDILFAKTRGRQYDVAVAMYHDQGHIPLKTVSFELDSSGRWVAVSGVNVTLGLPIVRTSVDHSKPLCVRKPESDRGKAAPLFLTHACLYWRVDSPARLEYNQLITVGGGR